MIIRELHRRSIDFNEIVALPPEIGNITRLETLLDSGNSQNLVSFSLTAKLRDICLPTWQVGVVESH